MKRLVVYFSFITVLLISIDIIFGYAAEFYIKKYGLQGDYKQIDYVMKKCEDDVLLIGSSVVLNSLMPSVIEDSIGITCYNAGANLQTFPYFHTILNCVLQRYSPKMVIIGMRPDELSGDDIGRYQLLVPYYNTGYNEIDSVLESRNAREKIFLKSNLYRYNTIWFRILLYHFVHGGDNTQKGFLPHDKPLIPPYMTNTICIKDVSYKKLNLMNDIVRLCEKRGIKLVFYFPPLYSHLEGKSGTIDYINQLGKDKGVVVYNDSQDSLFLSHQDWFYDIRHLTKDGAVEYSMMFASRLKHDCQECFQ